MVTVTTYPIGHDPLPGTLNGQPHQPIQLPTADPTPPFQLAAPPLELPQPGPPAWPRWQWPMPLHHTHDQITFSRVDWETFRNATNQMHCDTMDSFAMMEDQLKDLWEEFWEARRSSLPPHRYRESRRAFQHSTHGP